jgi:uncharacterized protein YbgA (DUF1722 family)
VTALNIRKNIGGLLHATASVVEQIKVPTKQQLNEKVDEYRIRAAALIMPNDAAFVIPGAKK